MTQKTLLVLGGTHFQIPPIQYAKSQGHRVVTCDYLPLNPGHRLADEYHDISTTDRKSILKLARALKIDGILAYASDPAAPTAAYVAQAMGLPGNPLESVEILTNKDRYRHFLRAHGFHAPKHRAASTLKEAQRHFHALCPPLMVKPVDSSGSKGVSRVQRIEELPLAFTQAMQFSHSKQVILEEWVEREGYQIAGDGFVVDGRLVFHCFAQEHFNAWAGRYVPAGESFPLMIAPPLRHRITTEIQRLIDELGLRNGALNFDIMVDSQQQIYLMEVGPRSGGNMIPEVIRLATGVDLTRYAVDAALGLDCSDLTQIDCQGYFSSVVIHSENNGHFDRLSIGPAWKVKSRHLFAAPGDAVTAYTGSHCSLGLLITAFPNAPTMLAHMDRLRDHVRVHLQPPPTRQDRRMLQDEFALGNVSNVGNVGTLALGSSQLALLSGL